MPKELTLDLGTDMPMKLMLIPPGKFVMGSPVTEQGALDDSERPQHEVTISKPYYMGTYPVTQEQYERVMEQSPSFFEGRTNPVETVSWMEAKDFVKKLSQMTGKKVSLPTEAQWEHACRAGSKAPFYFGADDRAMGDYAWYRRLAGEDLPGTQSVGQKKPNAWGLYDMHGNVSQYCADWYAEYAEGPATDPTGPVSGRFRVMRGGNWNFYSEQCRSGARYAVALFHRDPGTGFRIAVSPGPN